MKNLLLTIIVLSLFSHNYVFSQVDLQIESCQVAPVIDGSIDAIWNTTTEQHLEKVLAGNATSAADFSAYFKSLWDNENLYVLVNVTDDLKINDSDADWQDDAIEIYIDINNDKLDGYGLTDYQYTFAWNNNTSITANGPTSNFEFKIVDTANGYLLEVKMPWVTLGLAEAKSNVTLGYDVHVHDDDDGGDRDNKLAWFATEDQSWTNPSLFATVQLTGTIEVLYPADKPNVSVSRGFYQNPFDVTISSPIIGMEIYYTLDGSDPRTSASSQIEYSPALVRIDPDDQTNRGKTPAVVLRASAKKEGYDFSAVATRTYVFVDKVGEQTENPGHDWPNANKVGDQEIDLLIDPEVVNDSRYVNQLDDALLQIPTISIVTDNANLFDRDKGIYVNAQMRGEEWERPASIELINPDGSNGFQADFGLRIRGGYSRNPFFRKHAFRMFFRNEYGDGKLNFKLFGKEGASEFDKFDLRCSQNYSWSKGGGEAPYCTFNRDVFSRDVQRNMGDEYTRSRYYHLYLNGLYWGLYQTQERSEAKFAATYLGGNADDYDVVKRAGEGGDIEATDGNLDAWKEVWDFCQKGFSKNEDYYALQGLNAMGQRDPSLKVLVDIDNFIDYMNIIFYTGNFDAPVSSFAGNRMPNNFYTIRNRNDDKGFQFFAHDNEHTLNVDPMSPGFGITENRVSLGEAGHEWQVMVVDNFMQFHPQWLHHKLAENAEYRSRFADRAYQLYFNDGVLTPEKTAETFLNRTYEYDTAVVAESARWGDVDGWTTYTKDDSWIPIVERTVAEYFPQRTDIVIGQLQYAGLLSNIPVPEFRLNNLVQTNELLEIAAGTSISIRNAHTSGSLKYTLDGSDPRAAGGGISLTAVDGGNLTDQSIWQTTIIKARIYANNEWSSLHTLKVVVDKVIDGLQITEIQYNPLGQDGLSGSEFEFIEFKNRGTENISLTAASFNGIQYTFSGDAVIHPDQFLVLASSAYSFEQRYGFQPYGEYEGQLDNGGERISLLNVWQDTIISVKYNDKDPWPTVADGLGFSIVPAASDENADWDEGSNWRASAEIGGSPGADDGIADEVVEILVNEVLNNSEAPLVDAIELYNPNNAAVNISYWYLSDNRDNPTKWQIPAGTSIPANSYVVFKEGHYSGTTLEFNSNEFGSAFSLNSHGEEVYLFSGNSEGTLTGYEHGFDFGDADPDVAFGRHIISTGNDHFVAMSSNTFGSVNSLPKVGPVVINQIMYHPGENGFEFLQLVNISGDEVNLFEENSFIPWKLSGIGFDFPYDFTLQAGEAVYLVESAIHPNDFRFIHNLGDEVAVFNYSGSLSNSGEELLLQKSAPHYEENGEVKSPYVHVDKVVYNDNSKWPDADGNGYVLQRLSLNAYGNDPANWEAVAAGVSINGYDLAQGIEGVRYSRMLNASGGLTPYTWSIISGSLPTGVSLDPTTGRISGIPTAKGAFTFIVEVTDAQNETDEFEFTLEVKENTGPVAYDDVALSTMNYNVSVNVLENDEDLDGDRFNWLISIPVAPLHGSAFVNSDQSITYIPIDGFVGSDVLTYRIDDVNGWVEAQLNIEVREQEPAIVTLDVQVAESNDDAEENIESGQLWTSSSDLELTYDVNPGGDQLVGIRFQHIDIPQGALITAAYIQFTCDEVSTEETSLLIQAENEDLSLPFEGDFNVSSRIRATNSISWVPEPWGTEWESGDKQKTPALTDLVQAVIGRSGWTQGNALSFIFSGTGTRTAESFDGEQEKAAKLHIEYTVPVGEATIPVARVGEDLYKALNAAIQLDGSASYSADQRELNYYWTLVSKPAGSTAEISNPFTIQPNFMADVFGTYVVSLYVSNGVNKSETVQLNIVVENAIPLANAGADQQKMLGAQIMLNGSASYDPEGSPITYLWTMLEKPEGSTFELVNSAVVNPIFIADKLGTYRFSLVVFDGLSNSISNEVSITIVENQVPIADAGKDFEAYTGDQVYLDGSNSYDPEALPLSFNWTVVSIPAGSSAALSNATKQKPSFKADVQGEYVFRLTVNDGVNSSAVDEVKVTVVENKAPVADAGADQFIASGQRVYIDGSKSYDPEGKTLTYLWTILTTPAGSSAWISDPTAVSARFRPDQLGVYTLRLDVSDGRRTTSDQIQITVQEGNGVAAFDLDRSMHIYPNPFFGRLNVAYDADINQEVSFELYTISGALVQQIVRDELNAGVQELNFDEGKLNSGVYLLMVKTQNQTSKVFRITYQNKK
ncbi:MAG: sugar-binding protein [Prolixibacteraceae bacterium]